MQTEEILTAIDLQIAKLQQARELIAGAKAVEQSGPRRGRPKGSSNKTADAPVKRGMSAEGRARIAAAQKARWAAQKKAAEPAKKAPSATSKNSL